MHSKLINTLSAEQINDLEEMARRYKELDPDTLFSYLWKLTYDPEYALAKIGLVGDEFLQLYKKVRNYLFEEYGKPDILGDPEKYDKELFLALEQDKFAYTYISKKIDEAIDSYPKTELERISNLLSSEMENNQFGGLRSLGINLSEATYFQKFKTAIDLICKMFNEKFQEAEKNATDLNSNIIEEPKEDEEVENSNNSLEDEILINSFITCVNNKKDILEIFEKIDDIEDKEFSIKIDSYTIKFFEIFKSLFDQLEKIQEKGVDICFLANNMEAIKNLLKNY